METESIAELKALACATIDAWADRLWAVSAAIHANPELGYAEYQAATLLCGLLTEAGIPLERGIAQMPTAFRATIRGQAERPAIGILAEYDALPEVGHGCGHNLIGTAAVGAGLGLAAVAAQLPGSAVILGCPAEESAVDDSGGKIRLIRAGYFQEIDAAIMVHPGTEDVVSNRGSLAACGYEFEFIGKPAHAASCPHEGINALDGVIQTFNAINALRQHLLPDVRIHGIITYGGSSANVVPARAVCRFRIRAEDRNYLAEVVEKVKRCAQAGAQACGATLVIREVAPMYEDMRPNRVIGRVLRANLMAVGRKVRVQPRRKGKGSTDFGNVSHVVPSAGATVAITDTLVPGHSQEFAAAAISEAGRRMMHDSAKALAMTAIDLIVNQELLAAARKEFARHGL